MTAEDRARWEAKYKAGVHPEREPDPILERALAFAPPKGRALDVACGRGRHAIALARRGYEVDAVDLSPLGLACARERAGHLGVRWIEADLDVWKPPEGVYAVIVCVDFTDERLVPHLLGALAPGGVLAYAGRPRGQCSHGPRPGEAARWFRSLTTLCSRDDAGRVEFAGRRWPSGADFLTEPPERARRRRLGRGALPARTPGSKEPPRGAMTSRMRRLGSTLVLATLLGCDSRIGGWKTEDMAREGEAIARRALEDAAPRFQNLQYGRFVELRGSGYARSNSFYDIGDVNRTLVLVRTGVFENCEVPVVISVVEWHAGVGKPRVGVGTAGDHPVLRHVDDDAMRIADGAAIVAVYAYLGPPD